MFMEVEEEEEDPSPQPIRLSWDHMSLAWSKLCQRVPLRILQLGIIIYTFNFTVILPLSFLGYEFMGGQSKRIALSWLFWSLAIVALPFFIIWLFLTIIPLLSCILNIIILQPLRRPLKTYKSSLDTLTTTTCEV